MPMSANTLNPESSYENPQKSKSWKKILKFLVVAIVALAIIFVVFTLKNASNYAVVTIDGPGFTYSLNFAKNALQATDGDKSLVKGKDLHSSTMLLITVGPMTLTSGECHAGIGSSISVVSSEMVNGEQHNLCYASSVNSYEANFQHNGKWFYISVKAENGKTKVSPETAQSIVSSLKMN